jgi:hypothetical protein
LFERERPQGRFVFLLARIRFARKLTEFGIIVNAMAKFQVLSRQPEKLVLGKGGANGLGSLIGIVASALVVCVGMTALIEEGALFNPVMVVIGLIVTISLLSAASGALRSTRIVIDGAQRLATREDKIFLLPWRRQMLASNTIREARVSAPNIQNNLRRTAFSIWQVELRDVDGATLVVNERGAYAEMRALAEEVGALLGLPVRDSAEKASVLDARAEIFATTQPESLRPRAQAQTSAPRESSSVLLNEPATQMAALQAGIQTAANAPPSQTQMSARMPVLEMGMPMAFSEMMAFATNAATLAQTKDAAVADARLALSQNATMNPIEYALPPLAGMTQMSAAALFPPMMDLPALEPLTLDTKTLDGGAFALPERQPAVEPTPRADDAWGARESVAARQAAQAQFHAARQLHAQNNFADAQAAYEQALDNDPGNAHAHNDLGVLFLQQRKMAEAERAFRKAIALDPFLASGRYNLGVVLQRLGKRQAAQEQFRLGAMYSAGLAQDFQMALEGGANAPMLSAGAAR